MGLFNFALSLAVMTILAGADASVGGQTEEYRKNGCDRVLEDLTLDYLRAHEAVLLERFLPEADVEALVDSRLYLTKVNDLDPGAWDVRRRSWYLGMALLSDGTLMKLRVTALTEGQMACHHEKFLGVENLTLEK